MLIDIITPDKKVFEGNVDIATFPGIQGLFQVMDNHAPFISALGEGPLTIESKDGKQLFQVEGGVVEVLNNKITVLAESVK